MNYLIEIREFYDWLELNPLSSSAISLWHALMHINNKAKWIEEFAVSINTLELKTGLKRSSIYRARNQLKQYGRIDFKERNSNLSSIYRVFPFGTQDGTQSGTQTGTQNDTQSGTQSGTINKLNKTINNNLNLNKKGEPDFSVSTIEEFKEQIQDLPYDEQLELTSKYMSNKHAWKKAY